MAVSLGFFSMIFGWLFDVILQPIFRWLGELLGIVIGWVFDRVLGPIVEAVLMPLLEQIVKLIFRLLAEFFYSLLYPLYMLIDYIQKGFDMLIGLTPITYHLPQGGTKEFPLIEIIFNVPGIRTIFLSITILGVALAFVFAIIATIRSTLDFDFENKRPISQVLKSCMKSMFTFMLVPIFVMFMLRLSGVLLTGINSALTQGTNTTLGTSLFLIITFDAANDSQYNGANASMDGKDPVRSQYMNGEKNYNNMVHVRESFNIADFDFVVGFASAIFALIILGMCMILFVQRLFEVIMLYIISPLFVSVMPLDDGEKFSKWREVFIGKVFMGFGAAIAMRIYLMILPTIMNADVQFKLDDFFFNYLVKLVFMLGGMFTVYKSSGLLTSILSAQAAQHEESSAQAAGGKVAFGVMGAAGLALGAAGLGGAGNILTEAAWSVSGMDDLRQAYKGPINKAEMDIKGMAIKNESAKNADTLKAINRAQMGIGAPGTTAGSSAGAGGDSSARSDSGGSPSSNYTAFGSSVGSDGGKDSHWGIDDLKPGDPFASAGKGRTSSGDGSIFGGNALGSGNALGGSGIGTERSPKSKSGGAGSSYTGSGSGSPQPFTPPYSARPKKDDEKDDDRRSDRTDEKEQPQIYKPQDEKKRESDEEQKPKKKQRKPVPPPAKKITSDSKPDLLEEDDAELQMDRNGDPQEYREKSAPARKPIHSGRANGDRKTTPTPSDHAQKVHEDSPVDDSRRIDYSSTPYDSPGYPSTPYDSPGYSTVVDKKTGHSAPANGVSGNSAPKAQSFESKLDDLKVSSELDKKLGRTGKSPDKDESKDDADPEQKF